jgi:hypothetical protein
MHKRAKVCRKMGVISLPLGQYNQALFSGG